MSIDINSLKQWQHEQKQRLNWWCNGINIHCIPLGLFYTLSTERICELYNVDINYFRL